MKIERISILVMLGIFVGLFLLSACNSTDSAPQAKSKEDQKSTPSGDKINTPTKEPSQKSGADRIETTKIVEPQKPTRTPTPENWQDYPVIPDISPRAIEIYEQGIALGNDPHSFSKIGDCQNISTYFLTPFEDPKLHSLGEEYAYLQETIDWYFGSYSRESLAVAGGLNVARVLSPFHADVDQCAPNEHSLACEVRVNNPSVAIVSLEENWSDRTVEEYEEHFRKVIEYLIGEGVLPILATKADNLEGDHSINKTIARLAGEYEIPLWNFWLAVQPLPNHGVEKDGFHLTLAGPFFDDEWHLEAGWAWRNLTALQSLEAVILTVEGQ